MNTKYISLQKNGDETIIERDEHGDPETKFFHCSCHSEGVTVSFWEDDDGPLCIEMGYWGAWKTGTYSLKDKLRHIWQIIRVGHPWKDFVLLDSLAARKLGTYLIKMANHHENNAPSA